MTVQGCGCRNERVWVAPQTDNAPGSHAARVQGGPGGGPTGSCWPRGLHGACSRTHSCEEHPPQCVAGNRAFDQISESSGQWLLLGRCCSIRHSHTRLALPGSGAVVVAKEGEPRTSVVLARPVSVRTRDRRRSVGNHVVAAGMSQFVCPSLCRQRACGTLFAGAQGGSKHLDTGHRDHRGRRHDALDALLQAGGHGL